LLTRLRIENLVLIREAELELAPGLNAITGETGAGKTILAQAIGLLLGLRGDAAFVGPSAEEAYVEAEFTAGADDELALEELWPEGEEGLVVARRVFADGRTRAYAWGRSAAREDVAAAVERSLAMSGQFEQRRLARPAYQLDVLDSYIGEEQQRRRASLRTAWRELVAARRRHEELERGAAGEQARVEELRALAAATQGLEEGQEERLRGERERLRHVNELLQAATRAAEALSPEDGEGAAALTAAGERSLAAVQGIAPELDEAAAELRDAEVRLAETAVALRSFLGSLDADPARVEEVEAELDRLADARRRFRCQTFEELLTRGARARAELDAAGEGGDPARAAAEALRAAEQRVNELTEALTKARRKAAERFAEAVAQELRGVGIGEGEFRAALRDARPGPTGADEVAFLIRPNSGLPFAPVAETASGGELSRIALAIAAVGGGETLVFDEIDAGIGGTTAHAVAETLRRLATRAQVVTITHLPQIASVADRHFRVEKIPGDPTHTRIEQLDDASRRDEIERMLGGREFLATLQ
jgi:DNA repair protein RecN (Recombination protein N)